MNRWMVIIIVAADPLSCFLLEILLHCDNTPDVLPVPRAQPFRCNHTCN